jgi:ATPase family associated with various cellular activities (AAA)
MNNQEKTNNKLDFYTGINQQVWDLSDLILKSRFTQALLDGSSKYPIYRNLRFAVRADLEALFDNFALKLGWHAQRLSSSEIILDGDGVFITALGRRKSDYCSCDFNIWSENIEKMELAKKSILDLVGPSIISDNMFSINWNFLTSKGELQDASIEEMASDILHDAAYPEIKGGLEKFIKEYIDSPETVLVLQGPPGTGKTRLIRAILGEISRRKDGQARALYTGDKKTLESDEIFVKFITGWDDAFVVEDADHILKPRTQGNEHLHRFLTIADGVVRSQGRKIIFSTNLPNIGDIDDALTRPGRCFSRILMRNLTLIEAIDLIAELSANDATKNKAAKAVLESSKQSIFSLAEVYQIFNNA